MLGIEHFICLVGAVVLIYFMARPTPEKKPIKKDKNAKEIHPRGLPSTMTPEWFDPNYNDPRYF